MASLRTQDVDAIGMHPAPPRPQGVRLPQGSALEKRGMIYSPKSEEDDTMLNVEGFTGELATFNGQYGPRSTVKRGSSDQYHYYFQESDGPGVILWQKGYPLGGRWVSGKWRLMDNRGGKHGCLYEAEHDGKYDGPEDGTTSPPDDAVWEKPKDSAVIPKWVGNYDDDITVSTA